MARPPGLLLATGATDARLSGPPGEQSGATGVKRRADPLCRKKIATIDHFSRPPRR
ncbi:hypothetical protein D9M72_173580 [compost metagenome]